jgi:cell division protein FtsL
MSQQVNLFNPIFMKQRKYFSLLTMLQALGLIVVGSLLFYAYALYQVGRLEKQALENTRQFQSDKARIEKFKAEFSAEQTNQQLQDEVQQLEKKFSEQEQLVVTLKSGVIGNTLGYSQYMSAFSRQVVPGLWLTGFKVTGDGVQIGLNGAVTDGKLLPDYIQRLSREPIMRGKSFSTLQMQQVMSTPDKDSKQPAVPRYVGFSLQSTPDSEAKK